MSSLFNIGISGLKAQQAALSTVGHNITNASTPGYTRQRADLEAVVGASSSGFAAFSGTQVSQITRIADAFIDDQIRSDTSLKNELDVFSQSISQIEGSLFDSDFGMDAAIQGFFDSLQNAAAAPYDPAMRDFVLSSAEAMTTRFHGLSDRFALQATNLNVSLESAAVQINELSGLLVQVNERVAQLQSDRDTSALNTLLDQREVLLKDLSRYVAIKTAEQDDGQLNVFVGSGQPLVLGDETAKVSITGDGDIAMRAVGSSHEQIVTRSITGGELGGLLKYREDVLQPAQNQIGQLAAALSIAFNDQHRAGVDLQGDFGGDFFRDLNEPGLVSNRVDYLRGGANQNGVAPGGIEVYIEDPFSHAPSDYEIRFSQTNPGSYKVTRVSDSEVVFQGASLNDNTEISFDGIRVEFSTPSFSPGDALLIRPYANAAGDIGVNVTDPAAVALSAPVVVNADDANQSQAAASIGRILDIEHPVFAGDRELVPPILVEFISDTQYRLLDNSDPANPQVLQPDLGIGTIVPGAENQLLPFLPGSQVVNTSGAALERLQVASTYVAGLAAEPNGYPAGTATFRSAGGQTIDVAVAADSSARQIASLLGAQAGVHASAQTSLVISDLVTYNQGTPVELAVNGQLISGFNSLAELADAINANENLAGQAIVARSDGQTLELQALNGDDLNLHFQGDPNERIVVQNPKGTDVVLNGNLTGSYSSLTVGGSIAVVMDPGVTMQADLPGVFAAQPTHQRADFGFELKLSGKVSAGDRYEVDFNAGGTADNRNALALADLSSAKLLGNPGRSIREVFGSMVQTIGVSAAQTKINLDAADSLLQQSEAFRESVSGVNLDEEAANLIKHEQAYNAAAQLISVARDIFNVLINSVS